MGNELQATLPELSTRAMNFAPATANNDEQTVDCVMVTENRCRVMDFSRSEKGDAIEEVLLVKGAQFPPQVPLLDTHSRKSVADVLGSVKNIRIEGDRLVGTACFDKSDPAAIAAYRKVAAGHLTDFSAGYFVQKAAYIKPGERALVDGREFVAGPKQALRVSTAWVVKELSATPIGADREATARMEIVDAIGRTEKEKEMGKENGERQDILPPPPPVVAEPRIPDAAELKKLTLEGQRVERERVLAIREICAGEFPQIEEVAVKEGKGVDDVRAEVLTAVRKARPQINAEPQGKQVEAETQRAVIEGALCKQLIPGFGEEGMKRLLHRDDLIERALKMGGLRLSDVTRYCVRAHGLEECHDREQLFKRAMATFSLPTIFGNVADKALLKGFEYPSTAMRWVGVGSHADFKIAKRMRLNLVGTLQPISNGNVPDLDTANEDYENAQIGTQGSKFGITRQDVINDDLGALTRMPQKMGAESRRAIDHDVYTCLMSGTLTDTTTIFSTSPSHRNYISGATPASNDSRLNPEGLTRAITKMRQQTDTNGKLINCEPRYLIVPPELEFQAKQLMTSSLLIPAGGTSQTLNNPTSNPWQGSLEVIVEPRLSNAAYTGNSAVAWYLATDAALIDTITVGFLNGVQMPRLEQFPASPDFDGISWRVLFDFGVYPLGYFGLLMSKGAS
jgi:hypothetical protein